VKVALNADVLLETLNGEGKWSQQRKSWADMHRFQLRPNGDFMIPAEPDSYLQAERKMEELLRSYVDQWLDSGRLDGAEQANRRNYHGAVEAVNRASLCVMNTPVRVAFPEDGSGDPDVTFGSTRWHTSGKDDPLALAEAEAALMLAQFLMSDLRFQLAKCRYPKCGKYFSLENGKVRRLHRNGTFCSTAHNRAATAAEATRKRRDDADQRLLKKAAEFFRTWRSKSSRVKSSSCPCIAGTKARTHS